MVYFDCSAAGTTPWKAGTFSVIAVSCQSLPVSAAAPPALHAARIVVAAMTTAREKNLRTGTPPPFGVGRVLAPPREWAGSHRVTARVAAIRHACPSDTVTALLRMEADDTTEGDPWRPP